MTARSSATPRRPWRCVALLLSLLLLLGVGSAASSSSSSSSSDGDDVVLANDCSLFARHCDFNVSTASCVFRSSATFSCATDCRWELTGDLVLADGVAVALDGDDCALRVSANMLVLGANATLRATSVSVAAAFARLERGAEIDAAFRGTSFRGARALFPGDANATRGASLGGSGGRRLTLRDAAAPAQRAFGAFFDARAGQDQDPAVARRAARAWDLADLWARADAHGDPHEASLLLLGSGSPGAGAGGRVRVVASRDLVLMPGAAIRANGGDATGLAGAGGSGGSVFLSAAALSLGADSVVEARGGSAFCSPKVRGVSDCAPAGGGGRVHITYVSSQLDDRAVDVSGGALVFHGGEDDDEDDWRDRVAKLVHPVEQHALAGAAGTYLRVFRVAKPKGSDDQSSPAKTNKPALNATQTLFVEDTTASEAMLVVMNRRLLPSGIQDQDYRDDQRTTEWIGGGAVTPLEIDANASRRVDTLVVADGAAVATPGLAVGDLELRNGSFLLDASMCGSTTTSMTQAEANELAINAHNVVVSNKARVLLAAQSLTLLAVSLVLDATVEMRFARHVTLAAAKNLRIDARVSSPLDAGASTTATTTSSSLALIAGGDVVVGGASVAVGSLFIHADGSIAASASVLDASRAASIDARFAPCDPKRGKKSDPQASPQRITTAFLAFARSSNFTMLLQASHSISIGAPAPGVSNTTVLVAGAPIASSSSAIGPASPASSSSSSSPSQPVSLSASAILLCAENLIELGDAAVVSSNGRGEQANQGPGSGGCVGSVGGGGGYGGRGADSSAVNELGDYASGGLAYGTRSGIGMLGSGGGCVDGGAGGGVVMVGARGVVLNGQVHCNGDGGVQSGGGGSGGFLGLTIADFLKGHGRISAVGGGAQCVELSKHKDLREALEQPLQPGEDATANATSLSQGGRLGRRRLTSDAAMEKAVAADANAVETKTKTAITRVCGGGGGGGRLQLHGCELNDIDKCTRGFDGNYTVAGGATSSYSVPQSDGTSTGDGTAATTPDASDDVTVAAASSGSFVGFPCLPGSGGLFCRVCMPGSFKAESNSEECLPCSNAPSNAHYVGFGATTAECEWACNPGYSGDFCVSPIQQLLDACGGVLGFGVVLLSIVVFLILLGYACRTRKEPRGVHRGRHGAGAGAMDGVTGSKSERQHLLRSAIASTQRSRFACLLRWLYWPRVSYPKLVERDLPEHMARIYLTGMNDRDAPLKLRLTVPPALKSVLYDAEFRELAERINAALAWPTGVFGSWGEVVYRLVVLLCYPASSAVLAYRRHLRLNALKRIVARYNHACMKGPRARGLLNALKLGYSGDYSLVYLELLYKESSQSACVPTTAIGKPSLPIVLLFAGRGTYESPFYLDPSDLLVRSIPQCPELTAFIDEPWIEFVAELNELLRVVSNKDVALVETLLPVAQFLEKKMATATAAAVVGASYSSALAASTKLGGLRIYLGRFYVGDDVDCGEEFKLGVLVTTASSESGSSNHLSDSMMLTSSNLQAGGGGNGTRYAYGGPASSSMSSYGTTGPRHDALDSYGRGGGLEDGYLMYDPVSGGPALRRGSSTGANGANANGPPSHKSTVSSIREEALRIRSNTSGSVDNLLVAGHRLSDFDSPELLHGPRSGRNPGTQYNHRELRRRKRRQTFYEGWLGPVDGSLPVPGVLIAADELEDRLADRTPKQKLEWLVRKHLLPTNVPRSKWLGASWMVHGALLTLLMVDLAITFAMVVNLRCVTNGEVDTECSATILMPVLLLPPLTLFLAPIMGIVSLAIASNAFSRRYAIWNALSMGNVAVAILVCLTQSSRLVAPWFTAPLPLLPVIAMAVKAGEACVVERYIAFQETNRRRRGWRGLMKRRLSDASMPVETP